MFSYLRIIINTNISFAKKIQCTLTFLFSTIKMHVPCFTCSKYFLGSYGFAIVRPHLTLRRLAYFKFGQKF